MDCEKESPWLEICGEQPGKCTLNGSCELVEVGLPDLFQLQILVQEIRFQVSRVNESMQFGEKPYLITKTVLVWISSKSEGLVEIQGAFHVDKLTCHDIPYQSFFS